MGEGTKEYRRLQFVSQHGDGAAAEILAVGQNAQSAYESNLGIGHLSVAAFTSKLSYRLQDMKRSAGRRWLAAVDHAAAGLDRQLSLERKIRPLVITHVAFGTETEIFDLQVNNDDVVVIELEKIYVAVFDVGHFHRDPAGVLYAR